MSASSVNDKVRAGQNKPSSSKNSRATHISRQRTLRRSAPQTAEENSDYILQNPRRRGQQSLLSNLRKNTKSSQDGLEKIPFLGPGDLKKKKRAIKRGSLIVSHLATFYLIQLLFAIIAILMITVGVDWYWLSSILPETMLYAFCWFMLVFMGGAFMAYAAIMFTAGLVNIFNPGSIIGFVFCLVGYWSPYLFIFPWVMLWIAIVVYTQK